MNEKPLLTISLLVSDRMDTIRRCLDSIKPILDRLPSELILTDTSKNPKVRELCYEYTDKVLTFAWCNDFSAARNVGLREAKGEWFIFIDDDEWFEDATEFIEFFNSDEMYKYNYGKYVVRNYDNMEGTSWSDSIAGRMFRIFEGTKFIDDLGVQHLFPWRNVPIHRYRNRQMA